MRRPRPFDPNMLRLGPGRVSGMAAGKPATGEGGGNGENHGGNGGEFSRSKFSLGTIWVQSKI